MRSKSRSSTRPTSAWPRFVHHPWNARFCRSASFRVSAYGIFVSKLRASGLVLVRQLVEDVEDAIVPAPLLLRLREHRGGRPDPEVPVADHELGAWSPRRLRS